MAIMKKGAFQCALVEAVGTFLLALTVFHTKDPFAIGLILMAALYMGTHAHVPFLNTAVGFAEFFAKKIDFKAFMVTVAGQVIGVVGAALLSVRFSGVAPMLHTGLAPHLIGLLEGITTFVFVMVVMAVLSQADRFKNSELYGLVIGLTATGLAMLGGGIALFNPAIALGIMIHNLISGAAAEGIEAAIPAMHVVSFIVVPMVSSILAVWFHDYIQGAKR